MPWVSLREEVILEFEAFMGAARLLRAIERWCYRRREVERERERDPWRRRLRLAHQQTRLAEMTPDELEARRLQQRAYNVKWKAIQKHERRQAVNPQRCANSRCQAWFLPRKKGMRFCRENCGKATFERNRKQAIRAAAEPVKAMCPFCSQDYVKTRSDKEWCSRSCKWKYKRRAKSLAN